METTAQFKPFALHIAGYETSHHATFEGARTEFERLRDESGKGYRSWPKGKITAGKAIVYLSYNGGAWADEKLTRHVDRDVLVQLQRDADADAKARSEKAPRASQCGHTSWEIKAHLDRVCCDCGAVIGKGEPK